MLYFEPHATPGGGSGEQRPQEELGGEQVHVRRAGGDLGGLSWESLTQQGARCRSALRSEKQELRFQLLWPDAASPPLSLHSLMEREVTYHLLGVTSPSQRLKHPTSTEA